MGNSPSSERKRSKAIEKGLAKDAKAKQKIVKALVLGAEDSGKTFFLKQARNIYGGGYPAEEIEACKGDIHRDIISQALRLVRHLAPDLDTELCEPFQQDGFNEDSALNEVVAQNIIDLWSDAKDNVESTKIFRCQLKDNFAYYVQNLGRISEEGYVPVFEDFLQVDKSSNHAIEVDFTLEQAKCTLHDVGTLWHQPKKYMQFLDDQIKLIIYFVATNEYDQYSNAEENEWKIDASLTTFEEIVNCDKFDENTGVMLVLSKIHLFRQKLGTVAYRNLEGPLQRNVDFVEPEDPDWRGSQLEYEAALKHMEQRFRHAAGRRLFYSHESEVTDSATIQNLVIACIHKILQDKLYTFGFQ